MRDREECEGPARLEDHLDGRAPADIFKRFAGVRSLYG